MKDFPLPRRLRAVALAIFLASGTVRADVPGAAPLGPSSTPAPDWYGWQILLGDALSLGAVAYGLARERTDFIVGGATAQLLLGPAIHAAHGNPGVGAVTLLPRVGVPLMLGYLTLETGRRACQSDAAAGDLHKLDELDECEVAWVAGGLITGAVVATFLDVTGNPSGMVVVTPTIGRDLRGGWIPGLALVSH